MKRRSALIIAILVMTIGFAAISTTLIINGSAKVSENTDDFSVIFTSASLDGTDVYGNVISEDKKTITFETHDLKTLNQTSVLNYEVTNNSANYDAEVSVNCKVKENTTAKYTSIKNELENNATVIKSKTSINGAVTVTLDKVAIEEVSEEYTCKLEFSAVERENTVDKLSQFASDSWSTIAANVRSGNTSKYNIGDTKEVDIGDLGKHKVRIANMSECTNGETSETACGFVLEFVDILTEQQFNSTNIVTGGWKDSKMRTYVNNTLYNALPSDLKSVIATTNVISGHSSSSSESNFETQDKLYILSLRELFSDFIGDEALATDTAVNTTRTLDYYVKMGTTTGNHLATIKYYNSVAANWWLRVPIQISSQEIFGIGGVPSFICIGQDGAFALAQSSASVGVSPAFRIA